MKTIVINSEPEDGQLWYYNTDNDYTSVNESKTSEINTISPIFIVGQNGYSDIGFYGIWRDILYFNTSRIPVNAIIDEAKIVLVTEWDASTIDFNIIIQNGQPDNPHYPPVSEDFDYTLYSGDGGSINTSLLSNDVSFDIILNESGIGWINKGGITKLILRSDRDINSITPSDDLEDVEIYSYENEVSNDNIPKLIVTYHIEWPSGKVLVKGTKIIQEGILESYITGDNTSYPLYNAFGQTFSHSKNFTITKIKFKINTITNDATINCYVTTTSSGIPPQNFTSNYLTKKTFLTNTLIEGWNTITLSTPISLIGNIQYAIVFDTDITEAFYWNNDSADSTYPNGDLVIYGWFTPEAPSWTIYFGNDTMFEIYGY